MAGRKKNLRLNCVSVGTEAVFHVLIGLFSVCCIIPFLFVIIISFSSKESITTIGYSFIPTSWSMDAYQYAFNKLPQIWRPYFNSIYITVIGTVLSINPAATRLLEITPNCLGADFGVANRNAAISALVEKALTGEKAEENVALTGGEYLAAASPVKSDGAVSGVVPR